MSVTYVFQLDAQEDAILIIVNISKRGNIMTSYEIIKELQLINEMKNQFDEETGVFLYTDAEIATKYAAINADKEIKLNAIEDYKRSIKKDIELYAEKKKKQEANIKRSNNDIERLKEFQELLLDGEKYKNDEYTFYYTKSESVSIINADDLQDKYFKIEKKPILADIKKAIKEADKNEESFFGAILEQKKSLVVK